jgi:hypothetical protein
MGEEKYASQTRLPARVKETRGTIYPAFCNPYWEKLHAPSDRTMSRFIILSLTTSCWTVVTTVVDVSTIGVVRAALLCS